VSEYTKDIDIITDINDRMAFVVEASRRNVQNKTGGPFAAAVFEKESARLISLGVNLVTTQHLSMLHAEMVAISLAQRKLQTFDLGAHKPSHYELITSTEPCAMCLGAIPWSGISYVVSGATDSDARTIGFDEGVKALDWVEVLKRQHIEVIKEVQRDAAASVLQEYQDQCGVIYNATTL
jgi:tRNA(Arg) A34 adenosine deaminase TadA